LLYLASNSQTIEALLAQKDDDGNEQPIYYVRRTLKDTETRYPKIEMACLVVIYASQRLKRYFSAHQILLVTKSHPIKAFLYQPILTGRIAQYEAYLTGLTIAFSIEVKHTRVLGDSNLVVSQVKGDFALWEQSLAAYRTWVQRLEKEFRTFSVEYTQRSENRFADALATIGSQVPFKERDTLIRVSKQEHSIIGILKKMFPEEPEQ